MTADRYTHTETDAGLFEFRHGDTIYGYYRPTRAEVARDEWELRNERDSAAREDAAIDEADARRKEGWK